MKESHAMAPSFDWRAIAKTRWRNTEITGDGRFALLAMCDIASVLRAPGTYHRKGKPTLVTLLNPAALNAGRDRYFAKLRGEGRKHDTRAKASSSSATLRDAVLGELDPAHQTSAADQTSARAAAAPPSSVIKKRRVAKLRETAMKSTLNEVPEHIMRRAAGGCRVSDALAFVGDLLQEAEARAQGHTDKPQGQSARADVADDVVPPVAATDASDPLADLLEAPMPEHLLGKRSSVIAHGGTFGPPELTIAASNPSPHPARLPAVASMALAQTRKHRLVIAESLESMIATGESARQPDIARYAIGRDGRPYVTASPNLGAPQQPLKNDPNWWREPEGPLGALPLGHPLRR
jgi:hypothetical protein